MQPVGGLSGMQGIERVLRRIEQIEQRFEMMQILPPKTDAAAERHGSDADQTFRSALTRAQERQSTDGTIKEQAVETSGSPTASAAPTGRPAGAPGAVAKPMEKQLMDVLRRELPKHDVPPDLALAVMQAESNFNPRAVSPKGAIGVMQLMPGTASDLGVDDADDLFDPGVNIRAGLQHLSNLLSKYGGDEKLALAAYNAGSGAVSKHNGVPPYSETQNYIQRVFDIRRQLNEGASGS